MKILVFRIGNLGDTIIALPAFNAIRQKFPSDEIILLSSKNKGCHVHAQDVLSDSGLVDDVLVYEAEPKGPLRWLEFWRLRQKIKAIKPQKLIYLPPSLRTQHQIRRDERFFRWCGIAEIIGIDHFSEEARRDKDGHLLRLDKEGRFLLSHLEKNGVSARDAARGLLARLVGPGEIQRVDALFPRKPGVVPIALGIGGKGSAQKWPLERYQVVVKKLASAFAIEPVFFGGDEDVQNAKNLILSSGAGLDFCGRLNVREAVEAIKRCVLYLGNDTGTMHLAALAGVPCIALFSARANPGVWEPTGQGHSVIRKSVFCEGCELRDCDVPGHPCMEKISVEEVFEAVEKQLLKLNVPWRPCI